MMRPGSSKRRHLGAHEPELAVAQDTDPLIAAPGNDALLDDAASRCQRLGEDGNFVRDGIRNDVKVRDGEGEVLRVGPVLVHDAEDGPVRAVVPGAVRLEAAGLAGGTGEVDVTTDALAHQLLAVVRR